MKTSPRGLVRRLLALRLHIDEASIKETDHLEHLGLTPLDLVLVVLKLEWLDRGDGEFPLLALRQATTVGDLVRLVELWLEREALPIPVARGRLDAMAVQRRS
jgi:acyl carrier protein